MKFLILLLSIGIVDAVPYSYVGCFTDKRHEWVFFWWPNGPKNADGCAIACEAQKFSHFGMGGGFGNDCHCGSGGYDRYGSNGGCSDCNFNGQTYRCAQSSGDPWRLIAVYQLTSAIPRIDERFIGCWYAWNPPYMVGSPQQVGLGTKQNVSQCAGACKQQGAVYAGIRNNGTECYCGSDLLWKYDGRTPADTTNCYKACDDGKSCGGNINHISLYRAACLATEYGTNCSRCNCMNNVPCNAITGVCPGSCATEWTTPNPGGTCSVAFAECPTSYFGVNCMGRCHCENMVSCDKFNGTCPGVCAPTYGGPTCSDLLEVCDLSKNISNISYTRLQRKPNMAILGYDIAQFTAPLSRCVETCQKDSLCGSFNYEKSTKTCELKAYCRHKLTSSPGVHYIE